ncbi:MAG: pseudouridine synthase [Mariprofundaceae bacterium]|nr:pseudouridine synthase [Mariprofundaceae bacterium]
MTTLRFNKPFQVLTQFTDHAQRQTLADFIDVPNVYAAGRLDRDSEGLLLLTDDASLQHRIAHPDHKLSKTYWVQVDGAMDAQAIQHLQKGVMLKDGMTQAAQARIVEEPAWLWQRTPPIRVRQNISTSWLELIIREGRNRQVRRMTAAVGFPTLRLIRYAIGDISLEGLDVGHYETLSPQYIQSILPAPSSIVSKKRVSHAKKHHQSQYR